MGRLFSRRRAHTFSHEVGDTGLQTPTSEAVPYLEPKDEVDVKAVADPDGLSEDGLGIGPAPDGGAIAWLQVAAAFFAIFNSFGLVNTFGVYQTYYATEILSDRSPSQISWIGSVSGFLSQFMTIFVAPFIDKGYIKHLALIGCLIQSFAMMMLSLSTRYYQVMLTQAVVLGLGSSILFLVGIAAVTPYFEKRRGLALGIATAGSSIGGVIYPIALTRLFHEVGFGWSARIAGFIVLGTGLFTFVCIRRRLPPRRTGALIDFHSFVEPVMLVYALAFLFESGSQFMVKFYVQLYAKQLPHHGTVSLYLTAIINATSTAGRILPNFLSDRIGVYNTLIPAMICCTVLTFSWIGIHSENGMIAFSVLYGISYGPPISLEGPIIATISPDLRKLGIRLAFVSVFAAVGYLVAPPMAGIVLKKHGWLWLRVLIGCSTATSLILAIISRQLHTRGRVAVKA